MRDTHAGSSGISTLASSSSGSNESVPDSNPAPVTSVMTRHNLVKSQRKIEKINRSAQDVVDDIMSSYGKDAEEAESAAESFISGVAPLTKSTSSLATRRRCGSANRSGSDTTSAWSDSDAVGSLRVRALEDGVATYDGYDSLEELDDSLSESESQPTWPPEGAVNRAVLSALPTAVAGAENGNTRIGNNTRGEGERGGGGRGGGGGGGGGGGVILASTREQIRNERESFI
ncbi:PREDICTED: autophagy-related protein 20-like [Priapulus caudatus]|uniref:Autophagy-related protein 20-like n=1 Tax=Priapulus caudatus TaxID=37621 RepID=A0ABM1EML5_PRICU|nr:PREDICTED: autophagy-related protein 20-like [Priapulus caudatus]